MARKKQTAEEKDLEINTRLMDEFGLELGPKKRIYDHETGEITTIKGKEIVGPGYNPGKTALLFDPIGNTNMMNQLFGNYVNMLESFDEFDGRVLSYSTVKAPEKGKLQAVLKILPHDGGAVKETHSNPYYNETACYADLVCRINGDTDVDMSKYDFDHRAERQKAELKRMKEIAKAKKEAAKNDISKP